MLGNKQEREVSGGFFSLISFLPVRLRFPICGVGEHPFRRSKRLCLSGGSTVGVQSWFKAGWARAVCAQQLINLPSPCPAAAIPGPAAAENLVWFSRSRSGKVCAPRREAASSPAWAALDVCPPLSFPEGVPWGDCLGSRPHPLLSPCFWHPDRAGATLLI